LGKIITFVTDRQTAPIIYKSSPSSSSKTEELANWRGRRAPDKPKNQVVAGGPVQVFAANNEDDEDGDDDGDNDGLLF